MNRRKAIIRISLAGAGTIAAVGGYKWYGIVKKPDLAFLDGQQALITALAETIIPATDSPGATDAQVNLFIIKMVKDCTERKSQNKFIEGLKDLQVYTLTTYKKTYENCDHQEKEAILQHFERNAKPASALFGKIQRRFLGNSFFTTLKNYTVEGYCTSEPGATKGLAYVHVPGKFEGCITMQPGQKAWATS